MRESGKSMEQGRNTPTEMHCLLGQLQRDGLTGPFELADKSLLEAVSEVAIALQALQRAQNSLAALAGQELRHTTLINRHMAFNVVGELFRDTNLQSVVAACFGRDLVLWQTKFFPKYEGVGENRWHHDRIVENGDDPIRVYDTSNHWPCPIWAWNTAGSSTSGDRIGPSTVSTGTCRVSSTKCRTWSMTGSRR